MGTAFHATTKKRAPGILQKGLREQPFWKNMEPIRRPLGFKLKYSPYANVISGKTRVEIADAVYDSLRNATIHLSKTSRKKFDLRKMSFFFADIKKSKIENTKERIFLSTTMQSEAGTKFKGKLEELQLTSPPSALTEFVLTQKEIEELEKKTQNLDWLEANKLIARELAIKIINYPRR
ncbi:MAG: hypothetical protein WC821_02625 [archaeon]|jgi:hypothetical protein